MKKVYIEALYRIENAVVNTGYICIDGDTINCLFSLDYSYIKIINGSIHFYLIEYNLEYGCYYETEEFVGDNYIDILKTPHTYELKNDFGIKLSLEVIKKLSNPCLIKHIEKSFQEFLGK